MPTDLIQRTREAVATILDTDSAIAAITGRSFGNVVSWETLASESPTKIPVLAYLFVVADEKASDGDTREVLIQLTADAPKESDSHELLGVVETLLDQPSFLALTPPLDAFAVRRIRRGFNLDVTLRVDGTAVPTGPAQIPFDSILLHPDALDGEDFAGYANTAAWQADFAADYPIDTNANGTIDGSVTFGGHQTLKVVEGSYPNDGFAGWQTLASVHNKMWVRIMVRLSPTFAPTANSFLQNSSLYDKWPVAGGAGSHFYAQPDYELALETIGDEGVPGIGGVVSLPIVNLKGIWVPFICYADATVPATTRVAVWGPAGGSPLTDATSDSGSATVGMQSINAGFRLRTFAAPDLVNNYAHCGLYEFISGDGLALPPYTGITLP